MLWFLIMNASMNGLLTITDTLAKGNLAEEGQSMVLGIQTVETGVFGGIITGIMTALLHNKFHKISRWVTLCTYHHCSFFNSARCGYVLYLANGTRMDIWCRWSSR